MNSCEIRSLFSKQMSRMYKAEVPQYGILLDLVAQVNKEVLDVDRSLYESLQRAGELDRLSVERHGAIRLGTARELSTIRRLFAVMGMFPVGYYDLAAAGVPVHSTAFRPVAEDALRRNPFRVFTSLLRLDLITDQALRQTAGQILQTRNIFTNDALKLIKVAEKNGCLNDTQAELFVREALQTFRWHRQATVPLSLYKELSGAHKLIADVVSFKGPHINHLTPRTLDIDEVQRRMPALGISPKDVIEGPPLRKCPILLRQTSFKALEEEVAFPSAADAYLPGTHTARFGEIEQRGIALTAKGRALYDDLLSTARQEASDRETKGSYDYALKKVFQAFPDDYPTLRREGLAFFRYSRPASSLNIITKDTSPDSLEKQIADGALHADPIIYEDFLPVSAAGIFQSNLGRDERATFTLRDARSDFEEALGTGIIEEQDLYAAAQEASGVSFPAAIRRPA